MQYAVVQYCIVERCVNQHLLTSIVTSTKESGEIKSVIKKNSGEDKNQSCKGRLHSILSVLAAEVTELTAYRSILSLKLKAHFQVQG